MTAKLLILIVVVVMTLMVVVNLESLSTAGNTVDGGAASLSYHSVTASQLSPDECGGLAIRAMDLGGRNLRGKRTNDLLIADSKTRIISGGSGSDCLVASADYDGVLDGGKQSDVCIGGSLTTFKNCEVEIIR